MHLCWWISETPTISLREGGGGSEGRYIYYYRGETNFTALKVPACPGEAG